MNLCHYKEPKTNLSPFRDKKRIPHSIHPLSSFIPVYLLSFLCSPLFPLRTRLLINALLFMRPAYGFGDTTDQSSMQRKIVNPVPSISEGSTPSSPAHLFVHLLSGYSLINAWRTSAIS